VSADDADYIGRAATGADVEPGQIVRPLGHVDVVVPQARNQPPTVRVNLAGTDVGQRFCYLDDLTVGDPQIYWIGGCAATDGHQPCTADSQNIV